MTQTQSTTMTLSEIAATFPPVHCWTRAQDHLVRDAILAIAGSVWVCNHPNAKGERAVVVGIENRSTTTMELYAPNREHHKVHYCDALFFNKWYTPARGCEIKIAHQILKTVMTEIMEGTGEYTAEQTKWMINVCKHAHRILNHPSPYMCAQSNVTYKIAERRSSLR